MKITNTTNISLPLAVWLANDEYDYVNKPNYISATTLIRPIKQTILSRRILSKDRVMDVSDFLASSLGTAIHDSIEKAWSTKAGPILKSLGYPEKVADRVVVNPTEEQLKQDIIPVYVEQRHMKEIDGYIVGGKFDMVLEERLKDYKTTSVWSYIFGNKDEDYSLQGSIYRWIRPDIIKDDYTDIQFIFTDWQRSAAKQKPDTYPQQRVLEYPVKLMEIVDTEKWIRARLRELSRYMNLPEDQIPPCTDKELWRSETVYKYYADPNKTERATKNFSTQLAANAHLNEKGKGIVIPVAGEVKACAYCAAYDICKQKDAYNV